MIVPFRCDKVLRASNAVGPGAGLGWFRMTGGVSMIFSIGGGLKVTGLVVSPLKLPTTLKWYLLRSMKSWVVRLVCLAMTLAASLPSRVAAMTFTFVNKACNVLVDRASGFWVMKCALKPNLRNCSRVCCIDVANAGSYDWSSSRYMFTVDR